MMRPIPAALAYAASLDQTEAAGCDETTLEAIYKVGDLLGGLTRHGVRGGLQRHLDALSDPIAAGQPDELPMNGWQVEDAAREWLRDARAIMERTRVECVA